MPPGWYLPDGSVHSAPGGLLRSGVAWVRDAGQHVPDLIAARTTRPSPLPAQTHRPYKIGVHPPGPESGGPGESHPQKRRTLSWPCDTASRGSHTRDWPSCRDPEPLDLQGLWRRPFLSLRRQQTTEAGRPTLFVVIFDIEILQPHKATGPIRIVVVPDSVYPGAAVIGSE